MGGKKCAVCGQVPTDGAALHKIRHGHLCAACLQRLPVSVRGSLENFTAAQIAALGQVCRPGLVEGLNRRTVSRITFAEDEIGLNGFVWALRDLESVRLNFRPQVNLGSGRVRGIPSLVLVTRNPRVSFEELLLPAGETAVKTYQIHADPKHPGITYHWDPDLTELVEAIRSAVMSPAGSLRGYLNQLDARERARREEQQRRARESRERQTREESRRREQQARGEDKARSQNLPPEVAAVVRKYGLEIPFTREQVHRVRNQVLRTQKLHPDQGGSEEAFRRFYGEIELLQQYAVHTAAAN